MLQCILVKSAEKGKVQQLLPETIWIHYVEIIVEYPGQRKRIYRDKEHHNPLLQRYLSNLANGWLKEKVHPSKTVNHLRVCHYWIEVGKFASQSGLRISCCGPNLQLWQIPVINYQFAAPSLHKTRLEWWPKFVQPHVTSITLPQWTLTYVSC